MLGLMWKFIYDNPVAILSLVISIVSSDYLRRKMIRGVGVIRAGASARPILTIFVSFIIGGLVVSLCAFSSYGYISTCPNSNCSGGGFYEYYYSAPIALQIIGGILAGIVIYLISYNGVSTVIKEVSKTKSKESSEEE